MIDGTDAAVPEDYAGNGLADAASPRSKLRRDSRAASHVTLDAVAEAAGLRKGGVLYHFQTREAMLVAAGAVDGRHLQRCVCGCAGENGRRPMRA